MSAGSGLVSLMMMMGEHDGHLGSWSFHKGGNGGFTQMLGRAAEAFGAEIRLDSHVDHVITKEGQASRGRAAGRHRVPRRRRRQRSRPATDVHQAGQPPRAARQTWSKASTATSSTEPAPR